MVTWLFPEKNYVIVFKYSSNISSDVYCLIPHTRQSIKNGPSKICGRQPLKIWRGMICSNKQQTMWMSSANFTWSILEYFALYNQAEISRLSLVVLYILHYYCILVLTKIIIRWCKNYTFIPDSIIYVTVLYLLINFLWNYPTSLHSFIFPRCFVIPRLR